MDNSINIFDETPKYLQVAKIIVSKVDQQIWLPHKMIPTERALCEELNVSRTTIRRAINKLTDMFYLYSVHGKGTFVCPKELREFRKTSGMGFREHAINRGQIPSQEIISLQTVPLTEKIRKHLCLEESPNEVQKLVRLFSLDRRLDSLNTSYLKLPEGETITVSELEGTGSLYSLLRKKYNYIPYITCQESLALRSDKDIASLLQIDIGYPVTYIEGVVWTVEFNVMEYVEIIRGDRTIPHQSMNVGGYL
jgi:GntR family transcriptional regulator